MGKKIGKETEIQIKSQTEKTINTLLSDMNIPKFEKGEYLAELLSSMERFITKRLARDFLAYHLNDKMTPDSIPDSKMEHFNRVNEALQIILAEIGNLPEIIDVLHSFSKSLSNSLRPRAGHIFQNWVLKVLNKGLINENIVARKEVGKDRSWSNFLNKFFTDNLDLDIIVTYRTEEISLDNIIAIISCKTTIRDRIQMAIHQKELFQAHSDPKINRIKYVLVNAWDKWDKDLDIERGAQLDGIYVCRRNFQTIEGRSIKVFSELFIDLLDWSNRRPRASNLFTYR